MIVTGGRTPDPNNLAWDSPQLDLELNPGRCCSTIPIDTTEILLPAASSWVRQKKVGKSQNFPSQTPGAGLPRPLVGARAASLPLTLIVTGGQLGDDEDPTDEVLNIIITINAPFPDHSLLAR